MTERIPTVVFVVCLVTFGFGMVFGGTGLVLLSLIALPIAIFSGLFLLARVLNRRGLLESIGFSVTQVEALQSEVTYWTQRAHEAEAALDKNSSRSINWSPPTPHEEEA